jgi:hypothetical protein
VKTLFIRDGVGNLIFTSGILGFGTGITGDDHHVFALLPHSPLLSEGKLASVMLADCNSLAEAQAVRDLISAAILRGDAEIDVRVLLDVVREGRS